MGRQPEMPCQSAAHRFSTTPFSMLSQDNPAFHRLSGRRQSDTLQVNRHLVTRCIDQLNKSDRCPLGIAGRALGRE